jgi:hypothetical protein
MVAVQSHGRWSRATPLLLPANAAVGYYHDRLGATRAEATATR